MFEDIGNADKKVIIVKGKGKEAKYAQLLFQMISKIPGFELPQPITEAEYELMVSKVDDQGKVDTGRFIFFGNGTEVGTQGKSVDWRYDNFGMKYGWLGKRCVITADTKGISLKDQSEFSEYYNSRATDFESVLRLNEINYSETDTFIAEDVSLKLEEEESVTGKAKKIAKGIPLAIFNSAKKGALDTIDNARAIIERKELWERQYELLVCNFIINGFEQFIDSSSDKIVKERAIIVYDVKDAEFAHLLHNLIYEYSGYEVAEFTEKMFIDNAKSLSSKNKVIFLGNTKSAKERMRALQYGFSEHGMNYGRIANHAFLNVDKLKSNKRDAFVKFYIDKAKDYEDKGKDYEERNNPSIKDSIAKHSVFGVYAGFLAPKLLFVLPALAVGAAASIATDKVMAEIGTSKDINMYQHHLLLREFVFNGLSGFMEAN